MFFSRGQQLEAEQLGEGEAHEAGAVGVGVVGLDLGVGAVPQQALDHRGDLGRRAGLELGTVSVTGRKQVQYRPRSWVEHEGGAGLGDSGGAQRPPPFDELGEFGFDVDTDEAEEVDVLAVAGGDERQQFVGNVAALAA